MALACQDVLYIVGAWYEALVGIHGGLWMAFPVSPADVASKARRLISSPQLLGSSRSPSLYGVRFGVGLGGDERRLRNAAPECHGRRVAVMCFSTLVSATTFAACCLPVLHAVLPHACVGANPKAGPFRRYAVLS